MAQIYSYQMSTGDPRIWVFDGCECIGTLDPETRQLRRFISQEQSDEMLAAALEKKPQKPE